jgi:hypothetical protein
MIYEKNNNMVFLIKYTIEIKKIRTATITGMLIEFEKKTKSFPNFDAHLFLLKKKVYKIYIVFMFLKENT